MISKITQKTRKRIVYIKKNQLRVGLTILGIFSKDFLMP